MLPSTSPLPLPTLATVVLLLLQEPPEDVSDKVVNRPWQTLSVPVILPGSGFTVIVLVI
jgi:hypothetical protein